MKRLLLSFLLASVLLPASTLQAKDKYTDPYKGYDETVYMDMDLEQNILTPEVASGEHAAISRYMKNVGHSLAKKGIYRRHDARRRGRARNHPYR